MVSKSILLEINVCETLPYVPDKEIENKNKEQNRKDSSGVNINLLDLH